MTPFFQHTCCVERLLHRAIVLVWTNVDNFRWLKQISEAKYSRAPESTFVFHRQYSQACCSLQRWIGYLNPGSNCILHKLKENNEGEWRLTSIFLSPYFLASMIAWEILYKAIQLYICTVVSQQKRERKGNDWEETRGCERKIAWEKQTKERNAAELVLGQPPSKSAKQSKLQSNVLFCKETASSSFLVSNRYESLEWDLQTEMEKQLLFENSQKF